jgi:Fur family ferric uptake transcriptional regulator
MATHDCKTELNQADLRATPARIGVMRLLERASSPVDISTIKNCLKQQKIQADSATIFRIMNMFTRKGITRQLSFNEGKFRYELAINNDDHHHLICQDCGRVEDFSDCAISELEKDIKKKKNFLVQNHALEFYGQCSDCSLKHEK